MRFKLAFVPFVVAFMLPAAAQAEPHWYKSNVLIPEGEAVPLIEWGTLTFTSYPGDWAGPVTCEVVVAAQVENPVGGEGGRGQTNNMSFVNCSWAQCPPGEQEKTGQNREPIVDAYESPGLPWPSVLKQEYGIRQESTGVQVTLGCGLAKVFNESVNSKPPPGFVGRKEQFYLQAPVVCVTDSYSLQEPRIENGRNSIVTTKIVFDANAGRLSCEKESNFAKIAAKLKILGYNASELITANNP